MILIGALLGYPSTILQLVSRCARRGLFFRPLVQIISSSFQYHKRNLMASSTNKVAEALLLLRKADRTDLLTEAAVEMTETTSVRWASERVAVVVACSPPWRTRAEGAQVRKGHPSTKQAASQDLDTHHEEGSGAGPQRPASEPRREKSEKTMGRSVVSTA
ncbi:hypothetical protein NDU88_001046 [Pleurodeles waltl]|uniref:Uncharacterized protein n=1 Tax=Pleurodeles waltl TaxID=8319 RepID=A0AAV7WH75_PLEWA|nr:hypothetical protein NDU88_001046 [Pleurodeles waltl]